MSYKSKFPFPLTRVLPSNVQRHRGEMEVKALIKLNSNDCILKNFVPKYDSNHENKSCLLQPIEATQQMPKCFFLFATP